MRPVRLLTTLIGGLVMAALVAALTVSVGAQIGWITVDGVGQFAGASANPAISISNSGSGPALQVTGDLRASGYASGSRAAYGVLKTKTVAVTLSGATSVATGAIPANAFVVGVATTTTTAITGASGYQVGDGTTAARWGDITGTAVGTHSGASDYTADPTGWFATTAANITLTAKTSNFTAGVVQVVVFYVSSGSA